MFFRDNEPAISVTSTNVIKQVEENIDVFNQAAKLKVHIKKGTVQSGKFSGKDFYAITKIEILKKRETQSTLEVVDNTEE